ncbi:MBOAT family O-acyltransferase [Tunturiibacter lichenicola]|jgi:D-alanyl-lipoteichoic acid acyltransferase DltB (MBOAT superfamily)|uniref:MBOAT family O-acyltransferase n=1 Tax=Tunturiibacter lichenicola TaxID=2051959 RepID=UPI003D9BAE71
MLFSSNYFILLFLPASLLGYQLLSRLGRTALLTWLALVSLFFYGWWNPSYLLLLVASIILNFLFSRMVGPKSNANARSGWLFTAIAANLLLLTWFKYLFPLLNFFHRQGLIRHGFADVLLPLGISFFTFTQIAYLIDLRQGIAKQQGILAYTVFVTFFPHLIAGPIIHPREIMPQLEGDRLGSLRSDDMALGLSWFILGLGKKVLIADRIAPLADVLYAHPTSFGLTGTWLGVICYSMQLYFDFSGYSDMALGLARMFSIEFPINFDSPYKAPSIIEFWQRWHMTLSRYIAEYLYTPILQMVNSRRMDAGKKVSRKAQATLEGFVQMIFFPTMTAMFIAGIWHGAGAQFLIFGLLHGVYLVVNHAWRLLTPKGSSLHGKLPVPLSILGTFLCVVVSLIFFRASGVRDAVYILGTMVGVHGVGPVFNSNPLLQEIPRTSVFLTKISTATVAIAACFVIVWGIPNTQEILGQLKRDTVRLSSLLPRLMWRPTAAWSFVLMVLFGLSLLMLDTSTRFLYFQF